MYNQNNLFLSYILFFTSNHTGSNATNNLNLLALTFKLMQVVCVSCDIFFQPWSMKRWYQFLKFKVVFFFHFLWDCMKVVLYESILEELMCTNTLKRLNLVPYCWKKCKLYVHCSSAIMPRMVAHKSDLNLEFLWHSLLPHILVIIKVTLFKTTMY